MTKKSKKDNFLRNIIVGFGVVFVTLIVAVLLIDNFGPKNDYGDFDQINGAINVYTQDEDAYAVYFYSETCGGCIAVKSEVIDFGNSNNLDLKVYMLDAYKNGSPIDTSYVQGPGGVGLTSTPTLMLFESGQMIEFIVGADNVRNFFGAVEDGSYVLD